MKSLIDIFCDVICESIATYVVFPAILLSGHFVYSVY